LEVTDRVCFLWHSIEADGKERGSEGLRPPVMTLHREVVEVAEPLEAEHTKAALLAVHCMLKV